MGSVLVYNIVTIMQFSATQSVWKKLSLWIFIFVILVGVFGPIISVNAQQPPIATGLCYPPGPGRPFAANPASCDYSFVPYNKTNNPAPATPQPLAEGVDQTAGQGCGITNMFGCVWSFLEVIGILILTMTAALLWVAGVILNFVLNLTIVEMSKNISQFDGINIGWKLIRDMMNIVFIFMLVAQGIKLIIGMSSTDGIKKFIGFLILASLLVNFSLFFTKVMIDASNAVTIGIYNAILDEKPLAETGDDPQKWTNRSAIQGLSVKYTKSLGLNDIYSGRSFSSVINGDRSSVFVSQLLGSLLFIVTSFVFFAISIFFIIRYITLLVLLMLSPIAFMGMALPAIKQYSNQWWDSLRGQLIFPPVFMIMTWVVLTLISSPGFISTANEGGGITIGEMSTISMLFNYIIIIGLAIFTLITAKKTATEGSALVGQLTGKVSAFAGGAVMGSAARLGRTSFGRLGKVISSNASLQTAASKNNKNVFSRIAARGALYTARTGRDATFDLRNASVPGMPNMTPIGSYMAGIGGLGEGGKKGHRQLAEERKKEKQQKEAGYTDELALAQAKKAVIQGSENGASQTEIDAMEVALTKLSDKQTETLVANNRELLDKLSFANAISVKQLEAINKSDQFSDDEKNKLKGQRFSQIASINDVAGLDAIQVRTAGTRALTPNEVASAKIVDDARTRVKGLSDSELEMINPSYLDHNTTQGREFISQLRPGQVENITNNKSGKFTTTQRNIVKKERMRPLMEALGAPPIGSAPGTPWGAASIARVKQIIERADPKTMVGYMRMDGRAGVKIALDPSVLITYTPKTLQRMAAQDDMTSGDISNLRTAILGSGLPPTHPTIVWLRDPLKGVLEFPL